MTDDSVGDGTLAVTPRASDDGGSGYRQRLYRLASDPTRSPEARIRRLLAFGCEHLAVENAHIVAIDPDTGRHRVERTVGSDLVEAGTVSDLDETFCRRTVDADDVIAVGNPPAEGWADDPAYAAWQLGCYIGAPVRLEGRLYGTVCFVDSEPRDAFRSADRTFVRLTSQWVSRLLEQQMDREPLPTDDTQFDLFVGEVTDYAMFLLDPSGHVVSWNDGAQLITGYRKPEVIGRHVSVFYTEADRERGLPMQLLEQAQRAGRVEHEGPYVRRDHTTFRARSSITAIYDGGSLHGFGMVAHDVTERRERERALEDERAFIERALNALGDVFFVLDADESIRRVNDRALAVTGYSESELLSMELCELFDPADHKAIRSAVAEGLGTGETAVEATLHTRDGRQLEYEFRAKRLTDSAGNATGLAGIGRDITEQKSYKTRLEVAQRVLRHNLRNELNAIRAWTELAAETAEGQQRDALERVLAITDRLMELGEKTRELTTYSMLSAEQQVSLDVGELLPELLDSFRLQHPAATIESDLPAADSLSVSNGRRFETAVTNVIENAIEHNPDPEPWVCVAVDRTDGQLRVRVHDDGPGIPAEQRAVLEEGRETPLNHGSGIGLWLTYWAMRAVGGQVQFEDRDPTGSTVTLLFPLAAGE